MRILKYLFLLLLLISFAAAVFVATQKGDYEITKSRIINSPKAVVFGYVNDYRNWEDWVTWADQGTKFTYPIVTAGKGASFSWKNDESEGFMQTVSTIENQSIVQKSETDGLPGEMNWTFKDTLGKTKVTLKVKAKMGFMPKIYAALKGGVDKAAEVLYERDLAALDKTLDYEINTYKIKIDGIVNKTGSAYLYQSINSTIDNMPRNMRIMMSKLTHFFKKNNMQMYGKPFVLYKSYDTVRGITKFSVCIPIKEEIFTAPGSDVMSGKFGAFRAVKTTLNGDYSHLKEAWDKTFGYISTNNLVETDADYLELYSIGKTDIKSPSKWVTEIYIPITEATAVQQPITTVNAAVQNPPAAPTPAPKPQEQEKIPTP